MTDGIGMDMGIAGNAPRGLMPGGEERWTALRRRCRALLLLLLCAVPATAAVSSASHASLHGKRVLFLSSYDYGRAGVESYTRTYMNAMMEGGLASEDVVVAFLNLNTLSEPVLRTKMRDTVAHLPPDALLVTGNVNRDVAGNIATPVQFAAQLSRLANVPAFGLYNANLGQGILGGSIPDIEQRFRILVEHAPEAILVYDVDLDRFVDSNGSAQQILSRSREALLGCGPFDLYSSEQPDGLPLALMVEEHLRLVMLGETIHLERNIRRADGSVFPAEVRLVRLPMDGRRLVRGGIVDISARKRSEQELLGYRDQLEELVQQRTAALSVAVTEAQSANRAKSIFLANMSHELRTPLNSVIGFSQKMADSSSMFEEEKQNLAIINRAGHHLLTLINDILELSKIKASRMQLQTGPVDLNGLLGEVLEMVRMRARGQGIALCVERGNVVTPADLAQLVPVERQALFEAVSALDLRRSAIVLAGLATPLPQLVARMAAMLEHHQYRQLCLWLAQDVDEGQT